MPQPGQPYRPLIALPSQAVSVNPMLINCGGVSFKAWDPPRSLVPASAMVAAMTTKGPLATPSIPLPSPTLDPGPEETGTNHDRPSITTPIDQAAQTLASPQTTIATELPSDHISKPEANSQLQDALPGDTEQIPNDPPLKTDKNVGQAATSYPRSSPEPSNGLAPTTGGTQQVSNSPSDQQAYIIAIGSHKLEEAVTFNGQVAQPLSDAISIAGTRLAPGVAPITAHGSQTSLGNNVLVVGSSSIPIALPPVPLIAGQATKMNGQIIQPLNNGLSIAGQSLTPGAPPITVSGTPISLGSSSLLIGSSSYAIALPRSSWIPGQVTTINGQVIQPLTDGGIAIAGQTLTPGASPITISRTPISLGPSSLVIGASSIAITLPPQSWIPGQVTAINGQVVQPLKNGGISIDGKTLTPGALSITVSGTPILLGSAALFIGSSTVSLDSEVPEYFVTTVAGQPITADPAAIEVGSLELTPGGPGTSLSGTLVSLNSDGELIVGTRMIPLETTAGGLGGLIMSGLGPGGPYATSLAGLGNASGSVNSTATGNGVQAFEGRGKSSKSSSLSQLTMVVLSTTLVSLFSLKG